ncbi:MAG: hypothetical protein HUN04_08430 [Desulfobacter sp.]|nr:MAG: hypothetical protein HUN04_08430 [Desulfobacter sp.]
MTSKSIQSYSEAFSLDLDYVNPPAWLEDYKTRSNDLHGKFAAFENWVKTKFNRNVSVYIYGGNISGCIAYSFLRAMDMVCVQGVIDRNIPFPYLGEIPHIFPDSFSGNTDLVFVCTCPLHYDAVRRAIPGQDFCYMFRDNQDPKSHPPVSISSQDNLSAGYTKPDRGGAGIIMLGDSLTSGLQFSTGGDRFHIINKGCDGATVMDIQDGLDTVLGASAQAVFIMAGINDLIQGRVHSAVLKVYLNILDRLIGAGAKPIIQSTLYLSSFYQSLAGAATINREVDGLNDGLKKYCLERELVFLDLNRILSVQGYLQSGFTRDGLHLNTNGYKVWHNALMPLFP